MLFALALLAWSCQPKEDARPGAPEQPKVEASSPEDALLEESEPVPTEATADMELHEWGLIRYQAEQAAVVRSSACTDEQPPKPADGKPKKRNPIPKVKLDPVTVDKPVIYFHPGPSFDDSILLDVEVGMNDGVVREIWPTPEAGAQPTHGSRYLWKGVQVLRGGCDASSAPKTDGAACQNLGDTMSCEASELPTWLDSAPSCMLAHGVRTPVLLYNTRAATVGSVPLERRGDEIVHHGSHALAPVWLWDGAQLRRFARLEAGVSVPIESGTKVDTSEIGVFAKELRAELTAHGLTALETEHFLRAWLPLVGHDGETLDDARVDQPVDVLTADKSIVDRCSPAWPWQFFAFASQEGIHAMLPLRVEPAPRKIVRVLAVVVE
jgi:hypothetical protein